MVDWIPLGELGEIVAGSTPSTHVKEYWNGDIPWITPADLTNFQGVFFTGELRKITKAGYDSCSTKMLPAGSIIYSTRAPIGHCTVNAFPLCTNQGFKSIIPNENLNAVYGYYALRFLTPQIVAMGRGATFGEVNKEIFEGIRIPLPPLPEQQRIAAILDRADRLRRTRRYAAQLSETFLQAVFVRMFGDAVTRFQKWDVVEVQEVGESLDSKRIPVEASIRATKRGQYPYYGASGIIDYVDEYIFDEETLLVAEDGANLLARSTPIAFIASGKYWVNNHAHVLTMKDRCHILYLCELLNYTDLKPLVTGNAQPKLTAAKLAEMRIPLPPLVLQEKFARIVQQFERLRAQQREAERQAGHLFQALLQRAFGSRNLRN